ncbi:TonB-dependent receptor [Pectobacterium brasiliense]|uniref:TonB-dependent receptor n=1 Tax=Pectobacterium brasiliense TaxID=180957 RepID=UPI00333E66B3
MVCFRLVGAVGIHDRCPVHGIYAPTYDYGTIKQPKFSASYRLVGQSSMYANWGRSFQIGSGDGAYRRQPGNLGPSINDGLEAGFKFAPSAVMDGRLAYWEQRASGEVATILGASTLPCLRAPSAIPMAIP